MVSSSATQTGTVGLAPPARRVFFRREPEAELFELAEIVHPKSGKVKTETAWRGVFNMPFEVIAARK